MRMESEDKGGSEVDDVPETEEAERQGGRVKRERGGNGEKDLTSFGITQYMSTRITFPELRIPLSPI
jgi:hypothetical protein